MSMSLSLCLQPQSHLAHFSVLRPLPQAAHSCNADKYHDFSIVDQVVVPEDLDTGHYLLSWRWDCEQTTQIWQNCADVMVV